MSIHEVDDKELDDLILEIKRTLKMKSSDPNGPIHQSLRKLNAKCLLKAHRYFEATYNFVEALAPSVRTNAAYKIDKKICESDKKKKMIQSFIPVNENVQNSELLDGCSDLLNSLRVDNLIDNTNNPISPDNSYIKKSYIEHINNDQMEIQEMKRKLKELPEEWTVIQLTAGYDPCEQWETLSTIKASVKEFYITVLKNCFLDLNEVETLNVKISSTSEKPGEIPLFEELHSILKHNLKVIEIDSTKERASTYWDQRTDCDLRMKSVILSMERKWLGSWKCLLNGKILSKTLLKALYEYIDNLCSINRILFSSLQKMLMYILFSSVHYMTTIEASCMLHKIYIDHSRVIYEKDNFEKSSTCEICKRNMIVDKMCMNCLAKTISKSDEYKNYKKVFVDAFNRVKSEVDLPELKNCERGPIILLIDEKLDMFPWEVIPMLSNQPVTRMECLSFTYALFKEHIDKIRDGYFQLQPVVGNYFINPGGDLKHMENRMSSFIKYWCPQWEGQINSPSSLEIYEKYLKESDVFLYCGHGDGSQYTTGGAERLSAIKAIAILSGCGSVSVRHPGTRLLPIPTHSHFHIATCPSVIGMLWEVTDLEVDKFTSMLLSLFVPSNAPKPWGKLNKSQWSKGIIDTANADVNGNCELQPNLLRALGIAKRSSTFVLIAASIVARGLPIKIDRNFKI